MLIIDGYNVIYKIPALKEIIHQSLEKARIELAKYLNHWKRLRRYRFPIIIVFDSKDAPFTDCETSFKGIKFLFSHLGRNADEEIIAFIQKQKNRNTITVISEDNYVRNHCKVYGVTIQPVSYITHQDTQNRRKPQRREKKVSQKNASEINSYLKKVWNIH